MTYDEYAREIRKLQDTISSLAKENLDLLDRIDKFRKRTAGKEFVDVSELITEAHNGSGKLCPCDVAEVISRCTTYSFNDI